MNTSLPWEDDALSDGPPQCLPDDMTAATTETGASAHGRQLSVAEIASLGLPINDPFWILPEVFDAYLTGDDTPIKNAENSRSVEVADPVAIGPDAAAAQSIRRAAPDRAPLPSLDPRKRRPGSEDLPESVRRAIALMATPKMPHDQARGAAAHLLEWYRDAYQRHPAIGDMVLWWWKAARREVDIRAAWADEMRAIWKTDERQDAPDPAAASVNAFYGHLSYHAARAFVSAKGCKPDDSFGRQLLRDAGFASLDKPIQNARKRAWRTVDARRQLRSA